MNSTTTHPPPPTTHPQDNRALSWSQRLRDCLPIITAQQWREIWDKFNVTNLLFVYCLPFFYVFYPALLMPAIFMRTLSFFIGWLYQLIMSHHKDPVAARRRHKSFRKKSSPRRRRHANESNLTGTSASPGPSMLSRSMSSSSSEYDEDDSMEYWLRRCSICLDHKFALCLESCRDQFCKACFQRYVEEVVHQSWGLGVTRIQCPVCHDTIRQSEWSKYVSPATVEKYEQYNQPYRPFARYCTQCRAQVSPCQSPRTQGESRQTRILRIAHELETLEQDLMGHDDTLAVREAASLFRNTCQQGSVYRVGRVQNLYKQLAPLLARVAHHHPHLYHKAAFISKQMVALELIPEAWKQAQFLHVAHFSDETCPECKFDMCLQCGQATHGTLSCSDSMRKELDATTAPDVAATLRWKLEHTRSCPNCSVMINRDEGCNKVDCLYCGYQFCWSCRSGWSERLCGFYQCGMEKAESPSIQQADHKAELGVPDINMIDAAYEEEEEQ